MKVRQTRSPAHALIEAVRRSQEAEATGTCRPLLSALETFARASHPPANAFLGADKHPYQRLLINSPDDPFQIVLSRWAPTARSPIHDHAGLAGGVVCIAGAVLETRYAVQQSDAQGVRLKQVSVTHMQGPLATALHDGPEGQLHALVNPGSDWALTVHAYLGHLSQYCSYEPTGNGHFQPRPQPLWFDATDVSRAWL